MLLKSNPERAKMLMEQAQLSVDARYNKYRQLAEMSYKLKQEEPVAAK
jgi:hypothetical protein